jgi:hypothetical protein
MRGLRSGSGQSELSEHCSDRMFRQNVQKCQAFTVQSGRLRCRTEYYGSKQFFTPLSQFVFCVTPVAFHDITPVTHRTPYRTTAYAVRSFNMDAPASPTNRFHCSTCKHSKPYSDFPLNRRGAPYKTCTACREAAKARMASSRAVLGEVSPNVRRLRSRSVSLAACAPPPKRQRVTNGMIPPLPSKAPSCC